MILEKQFRKVYISDIEVAFSCLTSRTTMLSLSEIVASFKYFFYASFNYTYYLHI